MDKIRLGLSATLSGIYSLQGIDSFNGLLLWSEYQNSLGGIAVKELGKDLPVELVYLDDESNTEKTREITARIITKEKVDILLGPYSSSLGLTSAKVARDYGRVLWNYGSSTDEIFTKEFNNTLSSITPASRYFYPYLDFRKNEGPGCDTVAIVFAGDSGFSTQVANGAINYSKELGIKNRIYTYQSGTDSYKAIIDDIKDSRIKDIVGVGRFHDDLQFARYLTGTGACLTGASIEQFQNELGGDSEGFTSVTQWEPSMNINPDFGINSRDFSDLYFARFGKIPDYTSAQSFNMGIILANFIEKIGTLDENILKRSISSSKFNTFYGSFEIDPDSNVQTGHKTVLTQWQNGKKEIIYPRLHSTSEYKDP